MKTFLTWLALIPLTLIWPALQLLFFVVQGPYPYAFRDSLFYLPMGLLSGILLIRLWLRTTTRQQKNFLILGYLIASPFAFLSSVSSDLALSPLIGPLLCGGLPLIAGVGLGYVVGKKTEPPQ